MKKLKIDLKIGLEQLELGARDPVTSNVLGKYKSIFKGKGLEFESYRTFSPNDDASLIDWKASARSGELMVKEFVEERNMDVFFLIDVSNTMLLSSQPKLKCEYAAELVASLSYSITNSGDNIGYAMFNEKIVHFSPPARNLYPELIENISNADIYGGNHNLPVAIESIIDILHEGTIVILVSDFICTEKDCVSAINTLASKFSLIGIMIRDPIERKIPTGMGQLAIADPYSKDTLLMDPNLIKPYYEEEAKKQEREMRSIFKESGSDFIILQTNEDFIGSIIDLFKQREARWR